jgi:hypothetical protein
MFPDSTVLHKEQGVSSLLTSLAPMCTSRRQGDGSYYIVVADAVKLAAANNAAEVTYGIDRKGGVTVSWKAWAGGADEAWTCVKAVVRG